MSLKNILSGDPELGYLAVGGGLAFVMAFLRSLKFSRKSIALRLVEACMCSMLGTAITIGVVKYGNLDWEWAIPISIFIGFIGTDAIHVAIVGWLEYSAERLKRATDDAIDRVTPRDKDDDF